MRPSVSLCLVIAGLLLLAAALTLIQPYVRLIGSEDILQTELELPFNRAFALLMVAGGFALFGRYLEQRS